MLLATACLAGSASPAAAQSPKPTPPWQVTLYPVLGWFPIFGADLNVPPPPDGGGDNTHGSIDTRFTSALLVGLSVARGPWRVDSASMWAKLRGDRPELPRLSVDLDLLYGHVSGGRALVGDVYVTAGVRRVALKYDVHVEGLPSFSNTPGLWDPLIGIGWHRIGEKTQWHATLEGGGFGVGADQDISAGVRLDWKPISHVGITLGYEGLKLKLTRSVLTGTFTALQTLHGPIGGIGLYF